MNRTEFQAEIAKHAKPCRPTGKREVVRQYLETRRNARRSMAQLGLGKHGKEEAETKLLHAFFRRWMSTKYATLDMRFAKAKRQAIVRRDESGMSISFDNIPAMADNPILEMISNIPVFVDVEVDRRDKIEFSINLGEFSNGRAAKKYYAANRVIASCVCPDGFNHRHRRQFNSFKKLMIEGVAALIGRGSQQFHGNYNRNFELPRTSLSVLWAPLDEHWTLTAMPLFPKGDPAVLAELFGVHYVLDMFDTPDEKPIEGVIREFSDGKLP